MRGKLLSRNVTIDGRRTSLRLEEDMWAALGEVCERESVSLHTICTEIDRHRRNSSRTSAVRSFLVDYFRVAATDSGHGRAGHGKNGRGRRDATPDIGHLFEI